MELNYILINILTFNSLSQPYQNECFNKHKHGRHALFSLDRRVTGASITYHKHECQHRTVSFETVGFLMCRGGGGVLKAIGMSRVRKVLKRTRFDVPMLLLVDKVTP